MATFWERASAAHLVDHMIPLYLDYLLFYTAISRFGFEGWTRGLIASVPDLCTLLLYNIA